VITNGRLTLSPLRLEDAATHFAGEDAELVRWLNGGPGTLAGVESYIRRTIDQWAAGGPKLAFGIRDEGVQRSWRGRNPPVRTGIPSG
jgi:hypothetical protein